MLIVGYGIFIPNSRRRFIVLIGAFMVLPLLVTAGVRVIEQALGKVGTLIFDMLCWLFLGTMIATTGTNIIRSLGQQADEARQIGAYVLDHSPLGGGGMGVVFRAIHQQMLQPCAVKFINADGAIDPASRERFLQEARIMASVSHPNIVQVHNCGEHNGLLYLVMEYLNGLTLQQLVERSGPLSPSQVVHLLLQACSALAYLHRNKFVHNDVKPNNCKHSVNRHLPYLPVPETLRLLPAIFRISCPSA